MRNILGCGYEVKLSSEHPLGPDFSPLSLVSALAFLEVHWGSGSSLGQQLWACSKSYGRSLGHF